jgi:hypothetical protein
MRPSSNYCRHCLRDQNKFGCRRMKHHRNLRLLLTDDECYLAEVNKDQPRHLIDVRRLHKKPGVLRVIRQMIREMQRSLHRWNLE